MSLWPDFKNEDLDENHAISILREQARAIKSETNGVVCATFSKIQYKSGIITTVKTLSQVAATISMPIEDEPEEDLKDKTDINELFNKTSYKFEIYNSEYRFRLFVLNYSELFPVSLVVDEGILKEISYKNNAPISNNNELESIVREIFSSQKVRTVVSKMIYK